MSALTPCQQQPHLFEASPNEHATNLIPYAELCRERCPALAWCGSDLADRITKGDTPRSALQAGRLFDNRGHEITHLMKASAA